MKLQKRNFSGALDSNMKRRTGLFAYRLSNTLLSDRVTLFIKPTEYKRVIVGEVRQSRRKK